MRKGMLLLAAYVSLLLPGAVDPAAAAPVTFLSGNGNDANNCLTPATACRQFGTHFTGGAISKTDSGGTIHVLPGAYQPFSTIGFINILADQGQASIIGSIADSNSTLGLASIHIGQGARVRIRGLTFNNNDSGIAIVGSSGFGPTVYIENCTFKPGTGINNAGVELAPGFGSPVELYVSNSVFEGPGNGIFIQPTQGGNVRVVVNNVSVENSNAGFWLDARATNGVNRITIKDTTVGNGGTGIIFLEDASGSTSAAIENTNISNNSSAALLASGSTITTRVQDSMIVNNGAGLSGGSGAQVISHGGNVLAGNGTDGAFTSTAPPQ
jgi:hypothetical protein